MPGAFYETHVTVLCDSSSEAERLEIWSGAAGLKLTRIELARGRVPSQVMITFAGAPSLAEQAAGTERWVARLRAAGFGVERVKIESTPDAPEVPREPCSDGRYFEHHVKLVLDASADLEELARRVVPHGAHLSWNARRVRPDGRRERFVTQRCHEVDANGAGVALEVLLAELADLEIVEVEREFVLYDSDLSLDEGWIMDVREVAV